MSFMSNYFAIFSSYPTAKRQRCVEQLTASAVYISPCFSMMSLKRQHSKKGNFVSSNAGASGRDFALIFSRDIVDELSIHCCQ